MTIPLVRVEGEFAVARPIPWDDEDALRDHIDRVVDALTTATDVVEVETEAELDKGHVRLVIALAGADQEDADRAGRETLAASIRDCDGRHFQLLSEDEEEALTQKLPLRGGLLTPLWRLRTLTVGPVTRAGG
jgi:hypothetical protein